jgi:hypothetical protein
MKKIAITLLAALLLTTVFSSAALAAGNGGAAQGSSQEQAQGQNRVQTAVSDAAREQAKDQVRDRLQITEEARLQQQDRLQERDQDGECFSDTGTHWAREQVSSAYAWGLVGGYPDGSFSPDSNITGTQGVLMMSRLMDLVSGETEDLPGSSDEIAWERVPDWAVQEMQEASALRIMAQSQLYGEEKLNRLQFAVMLAKAADIEPEAIAEDTVAFLDQDSIPQEDLGYLAALRTLGILEGDNGNFVAERMVTRAEAAAMLTRILGILETETGTAA